MSQILKIVLAITIIAIIVSGAVYFWQQQKEASKQSQVQEDLKNYSSEQFTFQYPKQFFLLDRINEDKCIYISPNPISFNEFFNRYYEPVVISLTDESKGNSIIDNLQQKIVTEATFNGQNALIIAGEIPEQPPYYGYEVFAIVFPNKKISIIVTDEFKILTGKAIDPEVVAKEIASTFQFK